MRVEHFSRAGLWLSWGAPRRYFAVNLVGFTTSREGGATNCFSFLPPRWFRVRPGEWQVRRLL